MWHKALFAAVCLAVCCGALFYKLRSDYEALPAPVEIGDLPVSTVVLDRNDLLLRAFTSTDDKWRLPVEIGEIDPLYFDMLLAFEDQRFWTHKGVDPRAFLRAVYQSVVHGRLVSGGSTLTMQAARLLDETPTRSFGRKYEQILKALRLEAAHSKEDILQIYAMRAPFGGNLEGVRAASLVWFGKEPRRLTAAEAALLVALPQSPESRRPDRFPGNAKRARNRVLARAADASVLSPEEAEAAAFEPLRAKRHAMPFLAGHESRHAKLLMPGRSVHRLTLERGLQQRVENLAKRHAAKTPAPASLAIVVADHGTGDILASVGSPDLLDEDRQGHIDMTRAIRSPGSTLKPFIYGLAFDEGVGLPESLIVDQPIQIGGYTPANFDQSYQGTVTLRKALQLSLNTPAVQLLEAVGPARLVALLKKAGVRPVLNGRTAPGLAIGLGGLGMSLRQLVQAYAVLPRLGAPLKVTSCKLQCAGKPDAELPSRSVMTERSAGRLNEILSGLPQPVRSGGNPIAYKTGTAYGYRDAWAIGYDGKYVVGVWTGRTDGSPVPGQTGASAAVPVLFDVFQKMGLARLQLPKSPDPLQVEEKHGVQVPSALRYARVSTRPKPVQTDKKLEITYPPAGAEILMPNRPNDARRALKVKISGGAAPYRLLVNGTPVSSGTFVPELNWQHPSAGYSDLTVLDRKGASAAITVRLLGE